MIEGNIKPFEEVKTLVEEWFFKLQYERKLKNTNLLSKTVNNLPCETQENVRILISENINLIISKCIESKNVVDMRNACNAINGCFDNFIHAIDAVCYSASNLLSFIDFALDECQEEFSKKYVIMYCLLY